MLTNHFGGVTDLAKCRQNRLPKGIKSNSMSKAITNELINKRFWSLDQWKNGNDIERLVWFIATLSPHNYWRGEHAIREVLGKLIKESVSKIKK